MPDQEQRSYAKSTSELSTRVRGLEQRLTEESNTYKACVNEILESPMTREDRRYSGRIIRTLSTGINGEIKYAKEGLFNGGVDPKSKPARTVYRITVGSLYDPQGEYRMEVTEDLVRAREGTESTIIYKPTYMMLKDVQRVEALPGNFAQAFAQAVDKFQQHVDTHTGFAQQVQNLTDQIAPAPVSAPNPGI